MEPHNRPTGPQPARDPLAPLPPRAQRPSGLKRLAWPVLLLVSTASVMYYFTARAEVQRKLALVAATEQRRAGAEQRLTLATQALGKIVPRWYAGEVRQAFQDWQAGQPAAARARLDRRAWLDPEPDVATGPPGFEWRYLKRLCEPTPRQLIQPGAPAPTTLAAPAGAPFPLCAGWVAEPTAGRVGGVVFGPGAEDGPGDPSGQDRLVWSSPTARSVLLTADGRRWAALDEVGLWSGSTTPGGAQGPNPVAAGLRLVAIAPDGGRLLAVGDGDAASGMVLDAASGRTLLTLPEKLRVHTAAFGPDGQTLAVSGRPVTTEDGNLVEAADPPVRVSLWNLAESEKVASIATRLDWVQALALAGSPARLVVAGCDATRERRGLVEVWDPGADRPALTLAAHEGPVTHLAVSPDGRSLATGGSDRLVQFWRLQDEPGRTWGGPAGSRRATFRGLDGPVTALAFSPDGRTLHAADPTAAISRFDATADPEVQVLDELGYAPNTVLFTPDGQTLLAVDYKSVTRFDVASGRKLGSFTVDFWIFAAALSRDGTVLALGGETGEGGGKPALIHLVEPGTGIAKGIIRPGPGTQAVSSLAFSPDGRMLAVSVRGDEGFATDDPAEPAPVFEGTQLWQVAALTKLAEWPGPAGSLAIDPTGRRLVTYGPEGRLLVRELGDLKAEPRLIDAAAGSRLLMAPDGRTVVVGAPARGQIVAFDLGTGEPRWTLPGTGRSSPVALSPDGQTLALAEGENLVLVQVGTGEEFLRLGGLFYGADTAAFSPDGSALAAGGGSRDENDGIHLWRAAPAAR